MNIIHPVPAEKVVRLFLSEQARSPYTKDSIAKWFYRYIWPEDGIIDIPSIKGSNPAYMDLLRGTVDPEWLVVTQWSSPKAVHLIGIAPIVEVDYQVFHRVGEEKAEIRIDGGQWRVPREGMLWDDFKGSVWEDHLVERKF